MSNKLHTRTIRLVGPQQLQAALALLPNLPLGGDSPLELVIREAKPARSLDANARYWAGPLRDIAEQAWVAGRQYSAEVWHEHAKREFLPEESDPDLSELVKDPETWIKWDFSPSGERLLVGTTTRLTKKGFSQYMTKLEALGASMGVLFSSGRKYEQ